MHIEKMMKKQNAYRNWSLNFSLRKENSSKRLRNSNKVRFAWNVFSNKQWPRPLRTLMLSS